MVPSAPSAFPALWKSLSALFPALSCASMESLGQGTPHDGAGVKETENYIVHIRKAKHSQATRGGSRRCSPMGAQRVIKWAVIWLGLTLISWCVRRCSRLDLTYFPDRTLLRFICTGQMVPSPQASQLFSPFLGKASSIIKERPVRKQSCDSL